MHLHRHSPTDADWRPHPVALALYLAGVALLAWSVHDYAQMPSGQAGASPPTEPWRPAASKWSRAPATDAQRLSVAADAAPPADATVSTVSALKDSDH